MLLDTGASRNIVPSVFVKTDDVRPTLIKLFSASGQEIDVKGVE